MRLLSAMRRLLFSAGARQLWAVAAGVLTLVILGLALTPRTELLPSSGWDKLDHLAAFAVLAVCGQLAWRGLPRLHLKLAAGLLVFGLLIEAGQSLVPGRSADWLDVVADGAGMALGMVFTMALTRALDRRRLPRADGPHR
jgi:VanZ family protein